MVFQHSIRLGVTMLRSVSVLAACSAAVLLPAAAVSQEPVSEGEVRCFVSGDCQVVAEKKFTLANISTTPSRADPAAKVAVPSATRPRTSYVAPVKSQTFQGAGRARPMSRPKSLNMQLNFALNSADLLPGARAQADVFATVIKTSSGTGLFAIEGHTDTIGTREQNLDLSRRRAESVVSYLVAKGVPASQLQAVGYGFDKPGAGLRASNPLNRRVEIVRK